MDLFGERGYDNVTTRELADNAGVNLGLIAYYFGDKSGLRTAMLDQVISEIRVLIAPVSDAVWNELAACEHDRTAILGAARTFFENWCRSVLGDPRLQKRIPCVLRELVPPRLNFDVVYVGMIEPLETILAQLVTSYHGWQPDQPATLVRAHVMFNILYGLTANDLVFWRRMGWKRYTRKNVELTITLAVDAFLATITG